MKNVNKHGLSRKISSSIKRQIRQEAGFGCVTCGAAMIEYEHIDPPFTECTKHDPACMTVLCKACHGNVTGGMWSKAKVWEGKKNPEAKSKGFSHGGLDMGSGIPTVQIGQLIVKDSDNILTIGDTPIFSFLPPEEEGGPVRFNADIRDPLGNRIFQIVENEWRSNTENWDVEQTANRIKIRTEKGKIALEMEFHPRERVVFKRIDMFTHGLRLIGDDKTCTLETPHNGRIGLIGATISGNKHAVRYDPILDTLSIGEARNPQNPESYARFDNLRIGNPSPASQYPQNRLLSQTKVGRNKPCPCGSEKKYKFCCGRP